MLPVVVFRQIVDEKHVVEADLIICSPEDWDASDKAHDPAWSVVRVGLDVFALRLRGIPSTTWRIAARSSGDSITPRE